jgi:hypothetical protein
MNEVKTMQRWSGRINEPNTYRRIRIIIANTWKINVVKTMQQLSGRINEPNTCRKIES